MLKSNMIDRFISINSKFKNEQLPENVTNHIIVSNNLLSVNIELNDRKFLVLNASNQHMHDT